MSQAGLDTDDRSPSSPGKPTANSVMTPTKVTETPDRLIVCGNAKCFYIRCQLRNCGLTEGAPVFLAAHNCHVKGGADLPANAAHFPGGRSPAVGGVRMSVQRAADHPYSAVSPGQPDTPPTSRRRSTSPPYPQASRRGEKGCFMGRTPPAASELISKLSPSPTE